MKFLVSEKLSPHKYKTAEGYLVCVDAVLARTGKQSYMRDEVFGDGDDTVIEIDRTPEEVFSEATLASFENKPITVEHPDEDVNSENFKEYSVGFVRDVHRGVVDGQDVILGTLVIQDAQTIEEIENGEHTDLSCGYDCDIQDEENPQQRNIRGNHVALCAEGRAGNAKIMDSRKGLLDTTQKCVICGETFDGYGNNAEPVKKGICCDVCNIKYVIPARINKMHDSKKVKDKLSSSYRIIETLPNGYGIAQTYGDGLFYIFKDDEVLYGSYAFLENAKEALNKYKNVKDSKKVKDGWSLQQIKNLVNSYNSSVVAHDKINGYYISSASAYEIADIARKLNIPNQYSYEADGYFIDLAKVGIKDSKETLRRTTGNLIREEVNATEDYDNALMEKDLTSGQRKTFEEIRNDEIDHEEKLTNIYKDLKEGSVEEDIKDSCEDSMIVVSKWTRNNLDAAILKTDNGYTFMSAFVKEDRDFDALDEAEYYAKKLGYIRKSTNDVNTTEKVTKNLEKDFEKFKEDKMEDSKCRDEKDFSSYEELKKYVKSQGYEINPEFNKYNPREKYIKCTKGNKKFLLEVGRYSNGDFYIMSDMLRYDSKCKDSLTSEEIDLVNYAIKNLEHNNDADKLIKAMLVYYSKYADLAKEKPEEVKEYFRQHANDSKLYSITWKNGNKVMKSTLVADSMTSAIAKFQKYIQVRGIKDAMVDIEGIKKAVNQVRKVKKLKGDN